MTTPISATTLLEQSLAAIAEHGARTNAFILVDEAGARAAAHAVDDERRRGIDRGFVDGGRTTGVASTSARLTVHLARLGWIGGQPSVPPQA